MLRIIYFDYFQISKRVKLYEQPYGNMDGIVVIAHEHTLIYFSSPQVCLAASGSQVIEAVQQRLCCVTDHLGDVWVFLKYGKRRV